MPPALSAYLEGVRVLAALVVVLAHLSHRRFVGEPLTPLAAFMGDAVMVFFVLSGFVIAHAAQRGTARDYAVARVARILPVAWLALLVTFALDRAGLALNPDAYDGWWYVPLTAAQYPASALFVHRLWWINGEVGSMLPYWSLHNEVWYYAVFGLLVFARGPWRPPLIVAALLAMGPPILALWPIWMMGVLAQRIVAAGGSRRLGLVLAVLAPLGWATLLLLAGRPLIDASWVQRPQILQDYAAGLAFAVHVTGMGLWLRGVPLRRPALVRVLRWLAGGTFTLYLLHLPVAQFVGAAVPSGPGRGALLLAAAIGVPYLLAPSVERNRGTWRALAERAIGFRDRDAAR